MKELLLHPQTEQAVHRIVEASPHALLILGPKGSGKGTLAHMLAGKLLGVDDPQSYAYFHLVSPESTSVTIEQIRELNAFMRLKVPGQASVRRVAYIQQADSMTIEAQNALLKLLEEPPLGTVILLSAESPRNILPTIHSRVQTVTLLAPTMEAAREYFGQYSAKELERAYNLSNGQAGLLTALLEESDDHEVAKSISDAKKLYTQTAFERLAQVDQLAKQKVIAVDLVYACKRIASSGLQQAAAKGQVKLANAWKGRLEHILEAESALSMNANTKLVLTDLFVNL